MLHALVLLPRLLVEGQWFAEFDSAPVILRRWLLQLLGFGVVLGLGVPLQLQQLKRCWRLRQEAPRKSLPAAPLVTLGSRWLVLVLGVLLLLLAGGFTYLMVQARDLIAAPFSGKVITGIPVLADLPPLEQLQAKILGLLQAPATKLAVLINTPGSQLARVIKAKSEQV